MIKVKLKEIYENLGNLNNPENQSFNVQDEVSIASYEELADGSDTIIIITEWMNSKN